MDSIWNFIKLDLFISWPETFTVWLLAFSLFEKIPDMLYRRIALMTVTTSVATDLLYYALPLQWQFAYSFAWNVAGLFIIFREQPIRTKVGILCSMYIIVIVTDLASVSFFKYGFGESMSDIGQPSAILPTMLAMYPILALEFMAAWYIRRGSLSRLRHLFNVTLEGARRDIGPILLIIVVNFVLVASVESFYLLDKADSLLPLIPILLGASIALCLLMLAFMLRLLARTREESARMTQDIYVEEIDRMFTSIRGQRHDFLNHVQVMHTMLQMGKLPELKTYMADLVKESREVSDIVQHHTPALAAFVQAKTAVAVSRGIAFTYELSDDWSQLSTIRMIDIVKIVGNLVNNAFDEAERMPPDRRSVHAVMKCLPSHVELSVTNSGRTLNEGDKELIFLPGYTTKDNQHSGLGLSIVLDRVKHYRGTITVQLSDDDATVFAVQLPHRKPASSSGQAG